MNALLLVGSGKISRSTSQSLGEYLCERLHAHGYETSTRILWKAHKSESTITELLAATERADLLILAFPLFADSLPAPVVKALELIAQQRMQGTAKLQRLMVIVNSGFPEAKQNDVAVAICRQFTRQAGFEWAGALRLGGGGVVDGQPLQAVQDRAGTIIRALELSAEALAQGQVGPSEAVAAMARPIIPDWAYNLMGALGWLLQARKNKVLTRLWVRPYLSNREPG